MAKRLKDNITSDYVTASNRLNGRKARRRIVAYVEAYDDVFFWRMVLLFDGHFSFFTHKDYAIRHCSLRLKLSEILCKL